MVPRTFDVSVVALYRLYMYQTSVPSRLKASPDHIWGKVLECHQPACCTGLLELLLDPRGSDPRTFVKRVPRHDA